ncbi:hypothetical protein [Micromonospora sp. NPDC005324]|uniref:hypothetical protein n=1 Tax=Micromonospora sp. NPDC005324 TaxID=3157033 RepID=UPI0033A3314F
MRPTKAGGAGVADATVTVASYVVAAVSRTANGAATTSPGLMSSKPVLKVNAAAVPAVGCSA